MHDMEITDNLIQRYLNGYCTAAESDALNRYFKQHPELLNQYLMESWKEADSENLKVPDDPSMLQEIRKKTYQSAVVKKHIHFVRIASRIAGAAAVILLAVTGWMFLRPSSHSQKLEGHILPIVQPSKKPGTHVMEWRQTANRTNLKLKMKMADGSEVILLPGSSIRYANHFADPSLTTRDIYLQGQAFFNVAKDRSRPFTVYTGNMSTTALGTYFSVHENEKTVIVKLYNGKVKIHSIRNHPGQADIFLKPGEQMIYSLHANLATLSHFMIDKPAKKLLPEETTDNHDMVFDNTALSQVLEKLGHHYNVRISYDKTALTSMYFSGRVLESDSLSVILKVIGNMNGLEFKQTTDGFIALRLKD